jgi:large subunit ribosomal protein L15
LKRETLKPGLTYEFIQHSSTEEGIGKAQARGPRYGLRHGQDLHPWTQGPAFAHRYAPDPRFRRWPDAAAPPKRGFTNIFRKEFNIVSLERLVALGEELHASPITPEVLRKAGVIKQKLPVKILGDGELTIAITVHAHKFSKAAQEKITKAGGKVEVLQ